MDNLKETAEFFRQGLILGLYSVAEAMVWMDYVLTEESQPDIAIIDAALSGSRGARAVADCLAEVPGTCDRPDVAYRLLGAMSVLLRQNPAMVRTVVQWLYQMAQDDFVPDEEAKWQMWCFEDDYALAMDGVYGSVDEVRKGLQDFLARFEEAPGLPSLPLPALES